MRGQALGHITLPPTAPVLCQDLPAELSPSLPCLLEAAWGQDRREKQTALHQMVGSLGAVGRKGCCFSSAGRGQVGEGGGNSCFPTGDLRARGGLAAWGGRWVRHSSFWGEPLNSAPPASAAEGLALPGSEASLAWSRGGRCLPRVRQAGA